MSGVWQIIIHFTINMGRLTNNNKEIFKNEVFILMNSALAEACKESIATEEGMVKLE